MADLPIEVVVGSYPSGGPGIVLSEGVAERLLAHREETFVLVVEQGPNGPDEVTRDLPNVGEAALAHLGPDGLVREGEIVSHGMILVGCVAPRRAEPLSPEEKLLKAIFGEAAGDVVDRSLRVPPGVRGEVARVERVPKAGKEPERVEVTLGWDLPVVVGDVLGTDQGHEGMVVNIAPITEDLQWAGHEGERIGLSVVVHAREEAYARSIGPYAVGIHNLPREGARNVGGQRVRPGMVDRLIAQGALATLRELWGPKSDAISGRTRLYECIVKGELQPTRPAAPKPRPPAAGESILFQSLFTSAPDADRPDGVSALESNLRALGFAVDLTAHAGPVSLRFATDDEVREWSHGVVSTPETLNYKTGRPVAMGLMCARVFGPVDDLACSCGKYKRMKHRGIVCEKCGVEVIQSRVRNTRLGHVDLAIPLVHPWRRGSLAAALGWGVPQLDRVLAGEETVSGVVAGGSGQGGQAVYAEVVRRGIPTVDFLTVLPVLPPGRRPIELSGSKVFTHQVNDLYRRVVNRNNRLRRLLELNAPQIIMVNEAQQLQRAVDQLVDNPRFPNPVKGPDKRPLASLVDMLRTTLHRLHHKPVDFSARAMAWKDPALPQGACRLPAWLAEELFRPAIYADLEQQGYVTTIKSARRMVEKGAPQVRASLAKVVADRPVLVAPDREHDGVVSADVVLGTGVAVGLGSAVWAALALQGARTRVQIHVGWRDDVVDEARFCLRPGAPPRDVPAGTPGWLTPLLDDRADLGALLVDAAIEQAVDPMTDPKVAAMFGRHLGAHEDDGPVIAEDTASPVRDPGGASPVVSPGRSPEVASGHSEGGRRPTPPHVTGFSTEDVAEVPDDDDDFSVL